jgi:phosphoserine phosphatase RsbU/P
MSHATPLILDTPQLAVLADLSQAFAQSIDLNQTLIEAVNRIATHLRAEAASLFLQDPDSGDYVCRASAGPVNVSGLRVAHGHGIVGRCIALNQPQLVRDVQHDPDFMSAGIRIHGFMPRTMVCVPLSTANGAIGAMQVINKHDQLQFDEFDAHMLTLLAVPTSLALSNARLALELVEQNRIRREFELARQMQKTLLPKRRTDFPVTAINRPAREISGDFYDFFELNDGRIGFCIGDVSGKGMDAAMLMVRASSLLRFLGKSGVAPAAWLRNANDELAETVRFGMFVCALVGYYDPELGAVEIASAGFPPALMYVDGDSSPARIIEAHGPPLGVVPDVSYESDALCIAGASLYCFSDGMTDVRDSQGHVIGTEGAAALIAKSLHLPPAQRLRDVLTQLKNQTLPDDTTLLLIADAQAKDRTLLSLSCLSDATNLANLRGSLRNVLKKYGVDTDTAAQMVLALDEALANVIRHGYGGDCSGRIQLQIRLVGRELHIEIRDFAKTVNAECIKPRDLDECKAGGLGINLIDMTFDAWRFEAPTDESGPDTQNPTNADGNVLRLVKRL